MSPEEERDHLKHKLKEFEKLFQALSTAQDDMVCFNIRQLSRLGVAMLSIRDRDIREILEYRLGEVRPSESEHLHTEQVQNVTPPKIATAAKAQK